MSVLRSRRVQLPRGLESRVWEKGDGAPLVFLGGLRGLPRWPDLLDRLAATRHVIAPSLPGLPGATGHRALDDIADWVTATLDLIDACELDPSRGVDLVGASLGATLAAEVAVFSRASVRRLALVAPLGLFDESEPPADLFARRRSELAPLLCEHPERYAAFLARPDGEDEVEWEVTSSRAEEAVARLLWPLGDLGLSKRLHRLRAPTLLVWGERDRLLPPSYAKRFADALGGWVEICQIPGAGHMAELDAPEAVARAVLAFLG